MAKSEVVTQEDEGFDQEDILEENLENLPEEQRLTGLWELQWVSAKVKSGHSDNGPWTIINITLDPVHPAGEDAAEVAADYDLSDLPRVYHRMFYNKPGQKRQFVDLARNFGVAPGVLREMLEAARGQTAVAKLSQGKDNFGRPETKLSAFRAAA